MNTPTMKAVVLQEKGHITIEERPRPGAPGAGEVKIQMHTVGICGSDVHYYTEGKIGDFVLREPMILGHEGSGTVVEVGDGVTHLHVGDRVCMEPGIPSASSRAVREGHYNLDPNVVFWATPPVDGCLAEEVLHPAAFTYRLPENLSFAEGALIEPFAVGMEAATQAQIKPGDVAAVVGCGTIGIMTAIAALNGGASKVFISDVADNKLALVEGMSGIIPVNAAQENLGEVIAEATDGWGAQVVFECSGASAAYQDLWHLPAPGGMIVIVGMPVEPVQFDAVAAQVRGVRIHTVFRYANVYQKAIDLAATDGVNLGAFVTETFPVEKAVEVFDRGAEARPTDTKLQIQF